MEHDALPSRPGYRSQFGKHYGRLQALTGGGGSGGDIGVHEARSSSNEDRAGARESNMRSHSHYQHALHNLVPSSEGRSASDMTHVNQPNVGQTGLAGTSGWPSSQERAGEYAS